MRMPTVKITNTDEGLLVEQLGHSEKEGSEAPIEEKDTERNG